MTPVRTRAVNQRARRRTRWLVLVGLVVVAAIASVLVQRATGDEPHIIRAASEPLVIDGEDDVVLDAVHITSDEGDCLVIRNAKRVTIKNSEIGPCKGRAVMIHHSSEVRILDNYIHSEFKVSSCCDKGDSLFIYLTSDILVQGNVIAYGETNVEMLGVKDAKVIGNFLLNPLGPYPRGQQVQVWSYGKERSSDIVVENNYTLASKDKRYRYPDDQYDAINFGLTDRISVKDNYVSGGQSHSGCGIIADASANSMSIVNNTLVNTGQCGIGISSGVNNVVEGNRISNEGLNLPNAGNTALYVWKQYDGSCGPVRIAGNIAVLKRPNGTLSSYWDGGGCGPVTLTGNTFDKAAQDLLGNLADKYPAPSIPPLHHTQRPATPYSD